MDRWRGRVALVTGAFKGIGAALTRRLVREGMKVVGCGRSMDAAEKLTEELKNETGSFIPMKCDLTNEKEILSMFTDIKRDYGGVDVCINNAGLAHNEPLLTGATAAWNEMWQVNVMGLLICTREAYTSMKERDVDDGHIFFINSISGHRVYPDKSEHFYGATKFAVSAIREGVRNELRELNSHIRSTSISPGFVETEFIEKLFKSKDKAKEVYDKMEKSLTPDDIADAVIYSLKAPAHVQVHDILIRPIDQQY